MKSNDKCHEANELKRAKDLFACDCNRDSAAGAAAVADDDYYVADDDDVA